MSRDHGLWDIRGKPDVANAPCMKDCATQVHLASSMPEYAKGSHGDLAEQNRALGPVRGGPAAKGAPSAGPAGAQKGACLACHAADKKIVGPPFREVAARYQGQPDAEAKLVEKLRRGGSGAWGAVPMPANPQLSDADARHLVQWVLRGGS